MQIYDQLKAVLAVMGCESGICEECQVARKTKAKAKRTTDRVEGRGA